MNRKSKGFIVILAVSLVMMTVIACSGNKSSDKEYASATVTAGFSETGDNSGALQADAFLGTTADVASITVDVKNGGTSLITGAVLTNNGGTWQAVIDHLPIGPSLTFIGHAYNSSSVEIFTGTTVQAMTGSNDRVVIAMAPVASGATMQFPRITQISRPAQITASDTVPVSISVQGSSGETLTYVISPAANGGSFNPSSGSITLNGTTGTITVSYTAPAAAATFTHSVTVTNSQHNSVKVNFDTTTALQQTTADVSVQFNPVVTAIRAERSGSQVTFTATVSDDGPSGELRYAWSFSSGLSFADPTTNPAVLQGYDESVSGTVTVTVTDKNGAGGSTTVTYLISAGQFPDAVVVDSPTGPTALATGLNLPQAMAVDSANVYWTEKGSGTVKKVSLSGGAITTLATSTNGPYSIATDSTNVYWADNSAIKKIGKNGGAITTLVAGLAPPIHIAVDATSVYFKSGANCRLEKVGINGGAVTTVDASLGDVNALVVDATSVYWTEMSGYLMKVGSNGGSAVMLAGGLNNPSQLAVDAASVYWTEQNSNGVVKKIGKNGGAAATLASGLNNPSYLALDGTSVYWTESTLLRKASISGGSAATVASGLTNPTGLAVTSTSVIWEESSANGSIKMATK